MFIIGYIFQELGEGIVAGVTNYQANVKKGKDEKDVLGRTTEENGTDSFLKKYLTSKKTLVIKGDIS